MLVTDLNKEHSTTWTSNIENKTSNRLKEDRGENSNIRELWGKLVLQWPKETSMWFFCSLLWDTDIILRIKEEEIRGIGFTALTELKTVGRNVC